MGLLLSVIGFELRSLWREWDWLQAEWAWVRQTGVIGYPNISPRISYAQPPENWLYHEEGFTYLWGGWDTREGHRWFRVVSGDLNEAAISLPMGRDVFRAIDAPLTEAEGGPIWGRIPSDAPVVGLDLAGVATRLSPAGARPGAGRQRPDRRAADPGDLQSVRSPGLIASRSMRRRSTAGA